MTAPVQQAPTLPPMHRARLAWLLVVPALLLTVWLGARGLDADAIWNDEYYSIHDAGGPPYGPISPAAVWERVATRNPWHTPGYFVVLSGWGALVGWSPPVLRAFSLLVGALSVAWTYRLGRDMVSRRVGMYAAYLLGASAFFVHYLHELRMYTVFVLLTAFTVWVYLRIVDTRRKPRPVHWLGLFAAALAMLYTHYFAGLPLAAVGLYHLLFVRKDRRWWIVVGVLAAAGALFVPWVGWLVKGLQMAADSEQLHEIALTPVQALERLVTLFGNGVAPAFALLLALALVSLRSSRKRPGYAMSGARQAWWFALVTLAAILLTNAVLEIMHEGRVRYLMSAWALLAVVGGLGINELTRHAALRRMALPVLALWVVVGIAASLAPSSAGDVDGANSFPMHRVARALRDHVQPEDVIVSYLPDGFPFWVYERNQQITEFYLNGVSVDYTTARTMREPIDQPTEQEETLSAIDDSLRVWFAYDPRRVPSTMPALMSVVDTDYDQCRTQTASADLQIDLYTRLPICCARDDAALPPMIQYGAGDQQIALTGLQPLPDTVDDTLTVVTTWSVADGVPSDVYSVALHVVDANDAVVAQADYGLPALLFACQQAQIDVSALENGTYTLHVVVYQWQSGQRLAGTAVDSGASGDSLPLGRFTLE